MHREARSSSLAIALVLVLFISADASGGEDAAFRALAREPDARIYEVIAPLLPVAAAQIERFDADVGQVYVRRAFQTKVDSYQEILDLVWWVRRGEAPEVTNFIRDFSPGAEIEDVRAFRIRTGAFDARAALDADVHRLSTDRIIVTDGEGEGGFSNLVVGFDTAQPGDLLGLSIRTSRERPLVWEDWSLATRYPVARAELRLLCDQHRAYSVYGTRFSKEQMHQEIIETRGRQIADLRICADSIHPLRDDPYTAPRHLQSPQLAVSWRANWVRLGGGARIWWYKRHWNQIAVDLAETENSFLEKSGAVAKAAARLVEGMNPPEAGDCIYGFVRDELRDLDSDYFLTQDDLTTVDKILEARSGSLWEKAYLLLAMLRSVGLDTDLVAAHDAHRGGYWDEHPSWGQMTEPLVRVRLEDGERWYDLGCKQCRPGVLRPQVQDTEALAYDRDTEALHDRVRDLVLEKMQGRRADVFELYIENLKKKQWSTKLRTPGRRRGQAAWSEELVVFDSDAPAGGGTRMSLKSVGMTSLQSLLDEAGDVDSAAEDWARSRYGDTSDVTVLEVSEARADTLSIVLDLECGKVADPVGDTWILPPGTVYGRPLLEPWPEDRFSAIHIPRKTRRFLKCRVPLPEGWGTAEYPHSRVMNAGLLKYQVKYEIEGQDLVVSRILIEKPGTVHDPRLIAESAEGVADIIELESTPVVLRRKAGGP